VSVHPDSSAVLELTSRWEVPAEFTIAVARALEVRRHRELDAPAEPVGAVEHIEVAGADGPLEAIVYTPIGHRPAGLLVYFHGGGWSIGGPELAAARASAVANVGNCVVVSVRYRLAPEHRFPAGLEDAYYATCWVAEHACSLGVSLNAVAVGGDSSGGNFAAAVCLMARDRGGPGLAGQLLIYPATVHNLDTESRRRFATGYGLTLEALMWYWDHYLGPDADGSDPYVSPLLASHAGLPRAVVVTAGCDILRDDGELYVERLRNSGVPVAHRRFEGMLHGFLGYSGVVSGVGPEYQWIGEQLRQLYATHDLEVRR
jgi:acetyl esterase